MAKEDFCFTYYDGDAARDMAHMNRLERGGYSDIIISQRKFGRLTLDQIKKILGRDFNEIWPGIELVLKVDSEKFFIEWLENSIKKSKKHAEHQTANGKKGGRPRKENPNETQTKANTNPNLNKKKPLGNGDGNEYENVLEDVSFEGAGNFSFDETLQLPKRDLEAAERNQQLLTKSKNTDFIQTQWQIFLMERINDPPGEKAQRNSSPALVKYFLNWIRNKHPKNGTHQQGIAAGKRTKSSGAEDFTRESKEWVDSIRNADP